MEKEIIVLQQYSNHTDLELLRFVNMDLIALIEDPKGGRLLDAFLLAHNNYFESNELRLIKRYRKCLSVKGNTVSLKNPANRMSFFNTCESAQWNMRIQQNILLNSPNMLRGTIDKYFEKIKEDLRRNQTIMPLFYESIHAEISRRNKEAQKQLRSKRSFLDRFFSCF